LEQIIQDLISPQINGFNEFTPKLRVAVLASGEGTNFQELVNLSKNNILDIEIKILITNKINAGCIRRANESDIPFICIDHLKYSTKKEFEQEIINVLMKNNVELIVMAGWMRIVSETFVNTFKNKIINIHPSILPSFKGKSPIQDALNNKSLITGCSVHFVEKDVDNGKLLIQGAIGIEPNDNLKSLTRKMHKLEHKILPYGVSEAGFFIRNKLGI